MYTKALLALVPVAAQAAQSARWPVFNLRANVTEQYIGYGAQDWDRRDFWHNAPIGESSQGDVTGPLFDDSECGAPVRAGLNDHGKRSNVRISDLFVNLQQVRTSNLTSSTRTPLLLASTRPRRWLPAAATR